MFIFVVINLMKISPSAETFQMFLNCLKYDWNDFKKENMVMCNMQVRLIGYIKNNNEEHHDNCVLGEWLLKVTCFRSQDLKNYIKIWI